jgi:hypothetical protein
MDDEGRQGIHDGQGGPWPEGRIALQHPGDQVVEGLGRLGAEREQASGGLLLEGTQG